MYRWPQRPRCRGPMRTDRRTRPTSCAVRLSGCRRSQFLRWWVQPHWVPAVMAGAPSWGGGWWGGGFSPTGFRRSWRVLLPGVGGWWGGGFSPTGFRRSWRVLLPGLLGGWWGGWFSPTGFRRSSRVLLPDALHIRHGCKGIENSNSMVTERYITRITVSRQELPGQVADRVAAARNWESVGDDKSRKRPVVIEGGIGA